MRHAKQTRQTPRGATGNDPFGVAGLVKRFMASVTGKPLDENRRGADRLPMTSDVEVTELVPGGSAGRKFSVFLRDLSKRGCGLWSREAIEPGAYLMLGFPSAAGAEAIHRLARVRHCRGSAASGFVIGCSFEHQMSDAA